LKQIIDFFKKKNAILIFGCNILPDLITVILKHYFMILFRVAISENELRNMTRHLNVLHKKVAMLESANADLLSKHLHLVYKDSHIPKSTTCDCIMTTISNEKNNCKNN